MAVILNLETATKNCSVGIARDGQSTSMVEMATEKYVHSEKLHQFIQDALTQANSTFAELDAVTVSNGPGSYTGLRIGISAAKGLCFALNIPMIALNTNDILVSGIEPENKQAHFLSVIDARRDEVFARGYDSTKKPTSKIKAVVLEPGMFSEIEHLCIVGDAAIKTAELINHPSVEVLQQFPSASQMAKLSEEKYKAGDFVDVAYHEPYYLKEFVAGKPKKLL